MGLYELYVKLQTSIVVEADSEDDAVDKAYSGDVLADIYERASHIDETEMEVYDVVTIEDDDSASHEYDDSAYYWDDRIEVPWDYSGHFEKSRNAKAKRRL